MGRPRFKAKKDDDDNIVGIIEYDVKELDFEQAIVKLNDLEETRLRKSREINKLKAREGLYQRVIGGAIAYIELKLNEELWWDFNER